MAEQSFVIHAEAEQRKGDGTPVLDNNGNQTFDELGRVIRKDDGTLIVRHVSIAPPPMPDPPKMPSCISDDCFKAYDKELNAYKNECKFIMSEYKRVLNYHKKRVETANLMRDEYSLDYSIRDGRWSPKTGVEADAEIAKLNKKIKDYKK